MRMRRSGSERVQEGKRGMIIVFNKHTDAIKKLQESEQYRNAKLASVNGDGFLPKGVLSPYDYYRSKQDGGIFQEKGLFYDFLEVPEFWEIRFAGVQAAVYDMGCKKADIYFTEPLEKNNVRRVEWCMEDGWVYRIDHYNQYALKYASEFRDMDQNVESKVYYSARNQEVIVEQPGNDAVTLLQDGRMRAFFTSYTEFIAYFLREIAPEEQYVFFAQAEEDFRFLDRQPDGKGMWEKVLFSDGGLLEQYRGMGGSGDVDVYL